MNLSTLSDSQIKAEYRRRFTLPAGARVCSSEAAADHFRQYITDPARESFMILFLNGANRVITTETLFEGSLTSAAVYPREVIRRVLDNHAAAILLGHNHPSGNLTPSRDDLTLTNRIKTACATVDVALHDHLIISGDDYYSWADQGLF